MNRFIGVLLVLAAVLFVTDAQAAKFKRIYVFGDSYSDIGAGYLDGNGPTAVAVMAAKMNLPLVPSSDPNANSQSIDFAVTAAGTGEGAGKNMGGHVLMVGMVTQVEDFVARVKAKSIAFDPATTLFFIEGGLNDDETPAKTTTDNLTRQITLLKSVGARHISLSSLPTKVADFSKVADKLNPAYQQLVPALRKSLGVDLQLNHQGAYIDEVFTNAAHYGFVNTKDHCAGRKLFGEDDTPCKAPDTYFFYHDDHPSAAVNKIVGGKLYTEINSSFH